MKRFIVLIGSLLALALPAFGAAQASSTGSPSAQQPAPSVLFTPSSQAMGFELGGNYAVGTDLAETLNITKSCGIEGHQILVPSMNLQAYLGGVACTPDFSKLLAKTVLPTDTINFSFRGAAGVVRNTTGSVVVSNPSFLAGGCVSFNPGNTAVVVPTCFDYFRAPGFGPSANGMTFSAGIAYVFGH